MTSTTAHYLLIPSTSTSSIQEISIPLGPDPNENAYNGTHHAAQLHQLLHGPANGNEIICSDEGEMKMRMRGAGNNVNALNGEYEYTSCEALSRSDPSLPLNTRAAELLLTTPARPLHGPVLVSMIRFRHAPDSDSDSDSESDAKLGYYGGLTEAHLRSEEFREKRRQFLRLLEEEEENGDRVQARTQAEAWCRMLGVVPAAGNRVGFVRPAVGTGPGGSGSVPVYGFSDF